MSLETTDHWFIAKHCDEGFFDRYRWCEDGMDRCQGRESPSRGSVGGLCHIDSFAENADDSERSYKHRRDSAKCR